MIEKNCSSEEWTEIAKDIAADGHADIAAMLLQRGGVTTFIDRGVVHRSPFAGYRKRNIETLQTAAEPPALRVAPAAPPAPPSRSDPPPPPIDIRSFDDLVTASAGDDEDDEDLLSLFAPEEESRGYDAKALIDRRAAEQTKPDDLVECGFEMLVPPVEAGFEGLIEGFDDEEANEGEDDNGTL